MSPAGDEREILSWETFGEASRWLAQEVADTGSTLLSVQEFCAGKVAEVRTARSSTRSRTRW